MKACLIPCAFGLLLAAPSPVVARPNLDGPAIVVGFHITPPGPSEVLPLPRRPADIVSRAPAPGTYDAWLVVFTRAPLIGAWTLNVALDYDGRPGAGIDVVAWDNLSDVARPRPGWPEAGAGFGCEFLWDRARCFSPWQGLLKVDDEWWLQLAARIRVVAHGPDLLGLADPEPDVRPQEVECFDEYHPLDGTDNWTGIVPATFGGAVRVEAAMPRLVPVETLRWSELKLRSAP